jgi:two-component system aerobic respiration control sensor histidine kinase ArcB
MLSDDDCQSNGFSKKNYFDHLLSLTPSSVYWKDLNGVYLGCNLSMLDMIGLSTAEEAIGKTDYDLPWKDFADTLHKNDQKVIQSGKLLHFEETGMLGNGRIITVISNKMPLVDPSGKMLGTIGSSIDISAIKQAERAKQEFLQNMAHDLRTPLAGIIGLASLQASGDTCTPEEIKDYGQMIHGAGEQLLELLNAVIQVIDTEHMIDPVKATSFCLSELAQELQVLMEPATYSKGLQFKLKFDTKLPIVISDRIKLKRILLNLLSNAVKFTKQGEINLTIKLLSIENSRAKVEMQVADTGIGIAKDKIDKIFDHFYRAHPPHRAEYSGYGIGLYLVKTTLELLAGTIAVSSKEGNGTCFTLQFNFPLSYEEVCRTLELPSERLVVNFKSNRKAVLIAEDNSLALYAIKRILENLNYDVSTVMDGKAALHALQTQPFVWALLDVGLPDIGGTEVAKRYRQWEQKKNKPPVPLFALTAHALDKVTKKCKAAGINDIFSKPFSLKDLHTIEQYL